MGAHSQDVLLTFLSSEKVATQENVLVKKRKEYITHHQQVNLLLYLGVSENRVYPQL